ncbi:MAG: hypothetical protein WBB85_06585 [Albidovulum sp.]|uniref:hypothetical protein n=1 Tax=Albidovulum sp. TaxID=1872424 RepID=UPI003CBBDD40
MSTFPRILTSAAELSIVGIGLTLAMILSPFLTVPLSLLLMLLGLFTAITGRGVWRLRGRSRGVIVLEIAGIFAVAASQVFVKQREARWVELRQTDPDTYLTELAAIDDNRWLAELRLLRPERYAAEIERRETELQAQRDAEVAEAIRRAEVEAAEKREADARAAAAAQRMIAGSDDLDEHREMFARAATDLVTNGTCTETEFVTNGGWVHSTTFGSRPVYFMYCGGPTAANRLYLNAATGEVFRGTDGREAPTPAEDPSGQAAARLAECTDKKAGEAYVMIQSDVLRQLRAPSTAKFPWRYGAGTRHIGDCVYQVFGQFDAQNGFGDMLRGGFYGTIRYFPESGSWQTQSLSVN